MKMDFSVAWGRELATYEIADHAIAAEEAGFDMLGIIDTQNLARDPYPAMTIAALNTNRVRIGPSVTNTFTRHPSVTANAMATIDEISGGRAWIGLGSGFSAARTMDVGVQPMTLLENVIKFIHTYTSGQEAEFNGAKMHNEWISRRLPIYVHAAGPKTCDIGGRLGDGLLLASKGSPIVARWCLDLVRRAAESANRDPDDIDIRVCLPIFVEEEGGKGWDEMAASVATMCTGFYLSIFRHDRNPAVRSLISQLDADLLQDLKRVHDAYDYYQHERVDADHAKLVTRQLVDFVGLYGTADQICERIYELQQAGVKALDCHMWTFIDKKKQMRLIGEKIMPYFRN